MLPDDDKFRKWPSIEKMVCGIAHKVHGRVMAARLGHRVSVEDLIQEGAMTWMQSCEKFDPQYGVKFTTYLHRAVLTNLNRYVHNNGNIKHGVTAKMDSISQPISSEEGSTKTLEEVLDVGIVYGPDVLLEMQEDVDARMESLSPKARIIYRLMLAPPDWLREEFDAAKEQARLRRKMNIRPAGNAPPDIIVIAEIAKVVWDIEDYEFRSIKTELWRIQYGH
ncbi:MAG: hypothetical protein KAJ19_20555 [Gammaproteobacteria bacterium]|nr:hypothetical protein [Gammaproteobacteria bacterium]